MARRPSWFTITNNLGEVLAQHPRSRRLYFTKDRSKTLTTTSRVYMTRVLWQLAGVHAGLVLHVHDALPSRCRVTDGKD